MDKETSSEKMNTISECIRKAVRSGYVKDFLILDDGLSYKNARRIYSPGEVCICNFYRFEGESDPADNSILYLLRTRDGIKGTLLDAYGIYSDKGISNFIKEVSSIRKRLPRSKPRFRNLVFGIAIAGAVWWIGRKWLTRR